MTRTSYHYETEAQLEGLSVDEVATIFAGLPTYAVQDLLAHLLTVDTPAARLAAIYLRRRRASLLEAGLDDAEQAAQLCRRWPWH